IGREIQPVIEEFRQKKVLVGRPFPPMTTHMRVSVGTADEMDRFTKAFKEIFPAKAAVKTKAGGKRPDVLRSTFFFPGGGLIDRSPVFVLFRKLNCAVRRCTGTSPDIRLPLCLFLSEPRHIGRKMA